MAAAVFAGGRPYAWPLLSLVWTLGAVAGGVGYWELLYKTAFEQPTLHDRVGRYVIIAALVAIAFLRLPFYQGAFRMGRPLSIFATALFSICNAVLEGFVLLFLFDAGRWIFGEEAWGIKPGSTGYRAYEELDLQDRRMFREFLLGFAPYAIALISSYALLWEEHILPVHLDLGVTNKFIRPIMMVSMFTLLNYWFWGDVAAFVALRWIDNVLLALAVRMPAPGAELGPAIHPEDFSRTRAGGAAPAQGTSGAGEAAKRTPNRRRGQKKTN